MDIDTGPLKASILGSSSAFKVSNAQSSGGLARYHSAPSSVLASLLDDDFYPASDNLEFARLLNEGIQSFSPLLETKGSPQIDMSLPALTALPKEEDVYACASTVKDTQKKYLVPVGAFHEPLSQIPLSSISEHPVEETVDMYSHNQVSTPTGAPRHQFHDWRVDGPSHSALNSEFPISSFQQCNTGLIRQSSLPPDNLSGAARDGECLSEIQHVATFKQVPSPRMLTPLLRQSSSPAGLLSQVNLEDFTTPGVSSPAAFLERSRKLSGKGNGIGAWADGTPELAMQHLTALNQRKRWRNIEEKLSLEMVVTVPN